MSDLTPMHAEKTSKHSFADHIEKNRAEKHNSDLTNLAQAFEAVESAILELERLRRNIEATAADIEAGAVFPVEDIRKLYEQARQAGRPL